MRILFLSPVFLLPINSGMKERLYNLMKILHEQGHELGLLSVIHHEELNLIKDLPPWFKDTCFSEIRRPTSPRKPKNWLDLGRILRACALMLAGAPKLYALSYKPDLAQALQKHIDAYDLVCVETYLMCANISRPLFERNRHKLILVEHDIAYVPQERVYKLAYGFKRLRLYLRYLRSRYTESRLLRKFAHVVTMSSSDRDQILGLRGGQPVYVVPNGVDTAKIPFQPRERPSSSPKLLFVGGFDHAPNLDAVRVFVKDYMPMLRQAFPGLVFDVAGKCDHYDLSDMRAPDVNFLGFVPDLALAYHQATAAVATLRFGSGTKLKVLQAMAMGTPLMASDVAVEGLDLTPDRDYVRVMTPQEAVAAVGLLHTDFERARDMAENARQVCVEKYDWRNIGLKFIDILRQIINNNPTSPGSRP